MLPLHQSPLSLKYPRRFNQVLYPIELIAKLQCWDRTNDNLIYKIVCSMRLNDAQSEIWTHNVSIYSILSRARLANCAIRACDWDFLSTLWIYYIINFGFCQILFNGCSEIWTHVAAINRPNWLRISPLITTWVHSHKTRHFYNNSLLLLKIAVCASICY